MPAETSQQSEEAYHLLRCLIHMAMADSVLHEAEIRVLDQAVQAVGPIQAETWEDAWGIVYDGTQSSEEIFQDVPDKERLKRFILREMVGMAFIDGHIAQAERDMIVLAAQIFALPEREVERFIDWGQRAHAVYREGEQLLEPPTKD